MSSKLTELAQLRATALETKGLIGDVAAAAAADIEAAMPRRRTVALSAAGWTGTAAPYTQTVEVTGVRADEAGQMVQIVPAAASRDAWDAAGVQCTAQGAGMLTLSAQNKPGGNLNLYVILQEVAG